MNFSNPAASGLVLAVALTALAGCGGTNTALVGRDALPARVSRQADQNDIVRWWNGSILDPARFIFDRVQDIPEWLLIARRLG